MSAAPPLPLCELEVDPYQLVRWEAAVRLRARRGDRTVTKTCAYVRLKEDGCQCHVEGQGLPGDWKGFTL